MSEVLYVALRERERKRWRDGGMSEVLLYVALREREKERERERDGEKKMSF